MKKNINSYIFPVCSLFSIFKPKCIMYVYCSGFFPQIPSSCTGVYFLLVFQVFDVDLANLMSKKVNNNQVKMIHLQEDHNEQ